MKKQKKAVKRGASKKAAKVLADPKVKAIVQKHIEKYPETFGRPPTMAEVVAQPGGKELAKHSQKLRKKIETAKARYPERVPKKEKEPEPKIEVSVRSVYHDGQYLPALCFRKPGGLHVPCVCGDSVLGVRKFTIQVMQHDKSTVLQHTSELQSPI